VEGPRQAIGIIVNRVQTARDIHSKLAEQFGEDVHLVIGRMRPVDRDQLQEQLRTLVGPGRPETLPKPCFVVATQCLEVGADYDLDALITECASIDALRQRFGRLNRKGRQIDIVAAIVTNEASLKDEDPIYGNALKNTWEWLWLKKDDSHKIDFGISWFKPLWEEIERERQTYLDEDSTKFLLAPAPNAAVLLPAHLDALCQTAPYPEPSPDVSFFIHGPQRDNAEVGVCWRADLGDVEKLWPQIVGLLPPTSPECMTVPLHEVVNWMRSQSTKADADIPVHLDPDESRETGGRTVVIWRGSKDVGETRNPRDLRPGDTVVIPATAEDSLILGHVPKSSDGVLKLDIAEEAYKQAHRQRVVRVHPSVHPELTELLNYAASEESSFNKAGIRKCLGPLADDFKSGPEEIDYPSAPGKAIPALLLRFNKLLPNENELRPALDDDDGDSSSVESTQQVTLGTHTQHVVDRAKQAIDRLQLNGHSSLFVQSAELHDLGKADVRFQAILADLTPYEAMDRPTLLAKSGQRGLTRAERDRQRDRAELPAGFRHEMLSVELINSGSIEIDAAINRDLLLHLIAAHHGHARPFAPVVIDQADDESRSIAVNGVSINSDSRRKWTPSHRLDSGIAERFWKLTREYGWWGLAWRESVLRLADQQASAAEQQESTND
jgi:CRISPR-associated endonuclease/helicase Cas3